MIHNNSFIGIRNADAISKSFQQDTQILPSLDELQKGSEGSKGGKVIGHTKSGKAIYGSAHKKQHAEHHKDFSSEEHTEAARKLSRMPSEIEDNNEKAALYDDNAAWHSQKAKEKTKKD